ncbi:MAG: NAD(P)H-quinone oxidoreductase [Rhodospirillaceae bacterium]|jgi:NADPH:quinone reductase|nr:NAD(P)H-quinone oxidoreductase [Rhodospirillaceae bacterium]
MSLSIPETMTAIEVSEPGGPEVLRSVSRPVPQPGNNEILIKVASAGLNGADLSQRKGTYPMPPGVTDIPGLEAAGTVVSVGRDVDRFSPGDTVCALLAGGGYAEYAVAPAAQCMAVPPNISIEEAGGVPETFCTVWTNLMERGALKSGETVLIQGGTSGIGCTAIQMAKAWGATVLATARNDEKCRAMERLGADRAIRYVDEDFAEVSRSFTEGRGVDVILDIVGGPYIPRELEILAFEGRLVFINLRAGKIAEADFGHIHAKHLTVTGSRLRPRSTEEKGAICRQLEEYIWPHFATGAIKSETYRCFPMADAAEAHRLMETSEHIGKILLAP